MKRKSITLAVLAISVVATVSSQGATVLANWTFQVSGTTATSNSRVAEAGIFATTSVASTNSGGTISSPAGNGSTLSFSSNGWAAGEYYQFLSSSTGYIGGITVSFAQSTSNTGPGTFQFQYSTDGTTFVNFGSTYTGPTADFNATTANAGNVKFFDLSAVNALNNQASIGFRVVVAPGSLAENGGAISGTGTFRVDDFVVNAIPEPSAALLGGLGLLALLRRRR